MDEIHKLNDLLHYMKGFQPFSKTFRYLMWGNKNWCPFTHGDDIINPDCYRANPALNSVLEYMEKYVLCCRFLDVSRYSVDEMDSVLAKLRNPETMGYYDKFKELIEEFRKTIKSVEKDVTSRLSRVSCEETLRLDEALVCYQNYCFHSSIIMSVSAVETRIHEMFKRKDKRLYATHFERSTLGQLIQVFDENQFTEKKFQHVKTLMPKKHKPLVALLNQYRVFSAHPKEEDMTAQIAESVLHLSFAFTMDPATNPYEKDELICK